MVAARITLKTPVRFQDPLPEATDTVIIGGGVIGTFTALYLARAGHKVFLCEKGRIAGEQSSRNWGWIRRHGRDEGELPVAQRALALWHQVNEETNDACGIRTVGVNYLANDEKELAELEAWLPVGQRNGIQCKSLTKVDLQALFPGKNDLPWIGGTTTLDDARGEPWTAVPAVATLAQQSGAQIREECAVRRLQITAGKITGIHTEDGLIRCSQVLLAAGAWSGLFARAHGLPLPQLSVKATVAQTAPLPEFTIGNSVDSQLAFRRRADGGYSLALGDRHGFYLSPDAFRNFFRYLPALKASWDHTDLRLAAPADFPDAWRQKKNWTADEISPFERNRVLEPDPDQDYVARMQTRFRDRFPEIGSPEILTSWAGMIDAMPDVVPVVDRIDRIPGLLIATGMSGHGFGIGPGFGHALANMIQGLEPGEDLSRFRYERFFDGSKLKMGPSL